MNFLSESNDSNSFNEAEFNKAIESITELEAQKNTLFKTMDIKPYEPNDKRTLQMYIDEEVEPRETLGTHNPCQLKPSMKCLECSDEEWKEIETMIANPDVSKHICIQSTYSYTFFIYNSPKHGLVEITYSNWSGYYASVTPICRNYLASNIRPQEVKMTFNRYLIEITSCYTDSFITNPSLQMNDSIRALVESKKDEITEFYTSGSKYTVDMTPDEYVKNLYITLGSINDVTYFVTKSKIYMKDYDANKEFLILFAQLDEHNFVSTFLTLEE